MAERGPAVARRRRRAATAQRGIDLTTRQLHLRAETVDEESRSVEAVLATGARVQVFDLRRFEIIDEILVMSGADLPPQIILLDSHQRRSTEFVRGSARSLRIQGNQLLGRIHFAADDEASERDWQLVRQGHLTDVSLGYRATEFTDIEPGRTETVGGRRYTARDRVLRVSTAWRPRELSLLPIGADEAAKIRQEALRYTDLHRLDGRTPMDAPQAHYLADELNELIERQTRGRRSRDEVVGWMAEAAGVSRSAVEQLLDGSNERQPRQRLEGYAAVLDVPPELLIAAAELDAARSDTSDGDEAPDAHRGDADGADGGDEGGDG